MTITTIKDLYVHTPGAPVLDRVAAELTLTNHGRPGEAIAVGDTVRVVDTGEEVLVAAVDHQTGQINVAADGGPERPLAGVDVEVTALAQHPPLPVDFLDGMTLERARAEMATFASDHGRFPQYSGDYFAGWVFGLITEDIRGWATGPLDFRSGQRVLVRRDRDVSGMGAHTYTAYSTMRSRHGGSIAVWPHQVKLVSAPVPTEGTCRRCAQPIEFLRAAWQVDRGTYRAPDGHSFDWFHVGGENRCPAGTPGLVPLAAPEPACPMCRSRKVIHGDTPWGTTTDCPDCGHHAYHSIGD